MHTERPLSWASRQIPSVGMRHHRLGCRDRDPSNIHLKFWNAIFKTQTGILKFHLLGLEFTWFGLEIPSTWIGIIQIPPIWIANADSTHLNWNADIPNTWTGMQIFQTPGLECRYSKHLNWNKDCMYSVLLVCAITC